MSSWEEMSWCRNFLGWLFVKMSMAVSRAPAELPVKVLHQGEGHHLVLKIADEGRFERMRKRSVADIMQQDGGHHGLHLVVVDGGVLLAQGGEHPLHQPERTQGMGKPGVFTARKYQVGQPQLPDPPQPLHMGMVYQLQDQSPWARR
jgi:hypothetical protein